MMRVNKNKKGQAGFVITVELLLIVTVLVMGLLAGWAKLRDQTAAELADLGSAIGSIDQSYELYGHTWEQAAVDIASVAGWGFTDAPDTATAVDVGGDGQEIMYNDGDANSTRATPDEADTLF